MQEQQDPWGMSLEVTWSRGSPSPFILKWWGCPRVCLLSLSYPQRSWGGVGGQDEDWDCSEVCRETSWIWGCYGKTASVKLWNQRITGKLSRTIQEGKRAVAWAFTCKHEKTDVCVKSFLLCPTLCDPMECSLPGSSVHGILQARILEWVAMPSSRGSSWPRDWTCISCLPARGGESSTTSTTWEALKMLTEDYRSAFWIRIVHLLLFGAVLAPRGSVLESEGGAVASRVLWTECVPPHQI